MRETFKAYYRPTDDELTEIWSEGIIVLDTNTLLNFFRYTPSTRDEFLSVLEKLRESLWLPNHVGLEFHRRRLGVISTTSEAFEKITDSLSKAEKEIDSTLNGYKHHPSINRHELLQEVRDFFQSLAKKLEEQREEHHIRANGRGDDEQTFQRISTLFSGKIGSAFTPDELSLIHQEGATRYENQVPPGYRDKDDKNPNQYGDLIIWKEILRLGEEKKLPVIFVTDDTKEDWWWKSEGKTQGPRVELVDEYWIQAQRRIHFYEPLRFLEYAKDSTNTQISHESLEEVEEVSSANSHVHRVLRERQGNLAEQRDQLLSQLGRRRSELLSSSQHQELQEELKALVGQQRSLERHLNFLSQEKNFSMRNFDAHLGTSEKKNLIEQVTERQREIDRAERDLTISTRRQASIKHQLQQGGGHGQKLQQGLERQIGQLQSELDEINLALEELNE